jgi:hypothetical protein
MGKVGRYDMFEEMKQILAIGRFRIDKLMSVMVKWIERTLLILATLKPKAPPA